LRESLDQRSVRTLDFRNWLAFDAAEQQRGAAGGKPREKFTRIEAMLAAAG
jgi:ferredoxin--NADP+ reductase